MAQLLITTEPNWYQNIASVKNYYEANFEDKILKYAEDVFSNYHVLKCKTFDILERTDRSNKKRPDFILVSKSFTNWIIVEVETCGPTLSKHTKDQIRCFLNPEYDADALADHLIDRNPFMAKFKDELLDIVTNKVPKVLAIYDDYCQDIFKKLKTLFSDLQICVMETYRTSAHELEAYRISGEYPYEISGISQLKPLDDGQHFEVLRPALLEDIKDDAEIDLNFSMRTLKGKIFRSEEKTYLKIPQNPLPPDINIELNVDLSKSLIIKRL